MDFVSPNVISDFEPRKSREWTNEVTWSPPEKTEEPLPIWKWLKKNFFAQISRIVQLDVFWRRGGRREASKAFIPMPPNCKSPTNFTWSANMFNQSVQACPLSVNESNRHYKLNWNQLTPSNSVENCPTGLAKFGPEFLTEDEEK